MLRALVLTLAIAMPGVAAAEVFPQAIVGSEVHADDGTVIGHVTAVQRDRHGRIVSVAIPGLEPPDASTLAATMVAQNDNPRLRVIDVRYRGRAQRGGSSERALLR